MEAPNLNRMVVLKTEPFCFLMLSQMQNVNFICSFAQVRDGVIQLESNTDQPTDKLSLPQKLNRKMFRIFKNIRILISLQGGVL